MTKIYLKYKGLWVALKEDMRSVISSGKTLKEALEKAKEKGYEKPILFRVPTKVVPYIGVF